MSWLQGAINKIKGTRAEAQKPAENITLTETVPPNIENEKIALEKAKELLDLLDNIIAMCNEDIDTVTFLLKEAMAENNTEVIALLRSEFLQIKAEMAPLMKRRDEAKQLLETAEQAA